MRRMMPALLVLSVSLGASNCFGQNVPARLDAARTSDSKLVGAQNADNSQSSPSDVRPVLVQRQPLMMQYHQQPHSQLAGWMNCDPMHPNLWCSYPAERAATLAHLYRHLDGCDCLSPRRGLYDTPSAACGSGECGDAGSCGAGVCGAKRINRYKQPFSSLYATPSVTASKPCKLISHPRATTPAFSELYTVPSGCGEQGIVSQSSE